MKKGKRILALTGVILLIGMYAAVFISAFFTTPATKGLLMASLFATVAVPVMLYGYQLMYRLLKGKGSHTNEDSEQNH